MQLDWKKIDILINLALEEDIGAGDCTSLAVVPEGTRALGRLLAKEDCVCAGLPVAEAVFKKLDPKICFTAFVNEGEFCPRNTVLAEIRGDARAMLGAERTALNFLQRLCGIATCAKKYAMAVNGMKTKILDTRKTTPGWRNLEKYAVAIGGACNHRIGLYDKIMIKDNHRELAGAEGKNGIRKAVEAAREKFPNLEIEVEADSLEEVREAVRAEADWILLDNMDNETMAEAVKINAGRAKLEASGGITLERIPSIAALGVDYISCGALTHSVKSADISLDIVSPAKHDFPS